MSVIVNLEPTKTPTEIRILNAVTQSLSVRLLRAVFLDSRFAQDGVLNGRECFNFGNCDVL